MTFDIQEIRSKCSECNRNAPSNAPTPSVPATPPLTPFEQIFADFFEFGGHHYLVVGDRLSGWSEIFSTPSGSSCSGAHGLIKCLRSLFSVFGVPEELSSDGGPEFTSSVTKEFLTKWNVRHRISSAYHPQSNGQAEVAVKSAKRLLRSNTGPNGSLNSDELVTALPQYQNTPDPDCNLSPAQILFGKPLRDSMSFINKLEKYSNPHIRTTWREAWADKENALKVRFAKTSESLNEHTRKLKPLKVGDKCIIQNQTGPYPKKWHHTGTVVEVGEYDQYTIKVDGSGRLTKRNRRFLREYKPASMHIKNNLPLKDNARIDVGINEDKEEPTDFIPPPPPLTFDNGHNIDEQDNYREPLSDNISSSPLSLSTDPCIDNHDGNEEYSFREEQNIPRAIKRLLPHNNPGQKEKTTAPENGRLTRSGKYL